MNGSCTAVYNMIYPLKTALYVWGHVVLWDYFHEIHSKTVI